MEAQTKAMTWIKGGVGVCAANRRDVGNYSVLCIVCGDKVYKRYITVFGSLYLEELELSPLAYILATGDCYLCYILATGNLLDKIYTCL